MPNENNNALLVDGQPTEIVERPALPSVYVNSTRLLYSVYDFRLLLSEQMSNRAGEVFLVDHLSVVMAPQHMKRFVRTMIEKLADYEAKFGQIPEEPETADSESLPPEAQE